ncbi:hypothetical protein L3N51_01488 [Metallosphaera sp. J1]|uniref:toluene monooxygenase n=1 Tax=Metallosphaera javensis (ex Hofmann et al. 2022) TaxID=99938 RepID=UPI001EDDCEF7|nr:toluene monooxygenase [Metallosphaera javensis (ex Hofmann et al. 2022)]MCG3109198.1 hypothetical protein [Metallosphaera javensis (ex Hofmann et al. 2022)]
MTKLEELEWYRRYKELFGAFKNKPEGDPFFRDYEYRGYRRVWSTWPMLEKKLGRKKPSEYQVVTYALSYWSDPRSPTYIYDHGPFELGENHLTQKWYIHFRDNSPLIKPLFMRGQWHDYEDPYKLTYWTYNSMADDNETYLDKLYEEIVATRYDQRLTEDVLKLYRDVYDPLRFVFHTMQMDSAYLMSMAPTSSISNVFVFMEMDHMRRVQRVAQRIKMLDIVYPEFGFGTLGRKQFEESPVFQPTRKLMEILLATYDVGENLVGFTLAAKFVLDELLVDKLPEVFASKGDEMMRHIHMSFHNDTLRHRHQIAELFRYALGKEPSLKGVIKPWLDEWSARSYEGIQGFRDIFGESFDRVVSEIRRNHENYLREVGV